MQLSTLLTLTAISACALADPVANPDPQITGTPAPSQTSTIAAALEGLEEDLGLGDANELASVTAAIAKAPGPVQSAIEAALPNQATQNYPAFQSAVNALVTGTPAGFGALPTDVQGFVKSVASDEASIFNKGGAAPTGNAAPARLAVRGAGALLGVGVAGALFL